jgi:hypothetical protein
MTFYYIDNTAESMDDMVEIPFGKGSSVPVDPGFLYDFPESISTMLSRMVDPRTLTTNPDPQRNATVQRPTNLVFPPPDQPYAQLSLASVFTHLDETKVSPAFRRHMMGLVANINLSFLRGSMIDHLICMSKV